ncbi:MAG: blue light sensor protein [Hyphomicrobiales bacterium]|nr:MAG: blue light sensor protein [Hyphomicrobiales bacterium]
MPSTPLYRLAYSSTYRAGRIDSELSALRDILSQSRKNNEKADVTGYLIFDGDTFVQVLEGPRENVEATMSRIARDDRHRDVSVLAIHPTAGRAFHGWKMGGYRRSARQDPIFAAHGFPGKIERSQLSFETAVSLAEALCADQAKPGSQH